MLEIKNLHVSYDGIKALLGVDLKIMEGEIVTLIGANGAGKSTLLNTISGVVRPTKGSIRFLEEDITNLSPFEIVNKGLIQVIEGRGIFTRLTVVENLIVGAYTRKDKNNIKGSLMRIFEIFPSLSQRKHKLGGTLSGGEQQMLAIGRALMANPKLLMVDEPSLGLAPMLVNQVFNFMGYLREEEGVTILLVEQNVKKALQLADRGYVLENGKIVLSGEAKYLVNNGRVKEAYLGVYRNL